MVHMTRLAVAAAAAFSLAGCLVPEKFDASIRIKSDSAYVYKYAGSAVHYLAAAAIKQKGSLPEKDEDGLKREADKMSKTPGVQKMSYVGEGRYDIRIEENVASGQQVKSLKIFSITRDKEGAYVLAGPPMKEKDRDQLRALGIKVNGKAEVYLPDNAKVLEQNASGTPGMFSKSYSWKISGVDDRPMIKFMLQ